jgi:hypothetical protein
MMRRLAAWWERAFFTAAPAESLAGVRIVIAVHALWIVPSRDFAGMAALPAPFWAALPASTRARYLLLVPEPAWLAQATLALLVASLVALAVGWRARLAGAVAAALLYHVAPLEAAPWTHSAYERGLEISIVACLVLAVAPSGDAWAVGRAAPAPPPSAAYAWPVTLIRLLLASVYFNAFLSKLLRVGPAWVSAENLRRWLVVFEDQEQVGLFHAVGPWMARHPLLCLGAALLAMVVDGGLWLAALSRTARRWLVPLALAFHAGIALSMNIIFLNAPQLLVFVDWSAAARRRAAQSKATP